MKIAVVGVSGLVGQTMLKVLKERSFPVTELLAVASVRSEGKEISFMEKKYKIISIEEAVKQAPDIAFFSAGSTVSLEWAPVFAKNGTRVIDNSSAWRMNPDIPLVIPEVNGQIIKDDNMIIANPNCSTIQLLMVMAPLHRRFNIKRLVVSTYQSVTGTGTKAVKQMEDEMKGLQPEMVYPYRIFSNCLPHCDEFMDNAYSKEEMKLVNETRKILNDQNIRVTATAVRVPVTGGHSESVNAEFATVVNAEDARQVLSQTQGVTVLDEPLNNTYPMPYFSKDKDEVFVGRIREDYSMDNSLNLWIVADNIRKGAATNAIQIGEEIIRH
ncbi:MAG: aspartate-semialdehyde dehydrogenase [Bacteroidales bacterium]|nr:aspartate-semialdehyde dehydrogenase [Bacteroidales bacterium]